MKNRYLLFLLLISSHLSFGQNFNFLGSYSSNGTPNYLMDPGDDVSVETLELIDRSIPETFRVPAYNPHYISSGYDTDLRLAAQSEVFVTFISEGAGFRNVLGYYTYDLDNPLTSRPADEDITIIFPNASARGSGGGLRPGDKVSLGTFPANTGIGWVLLSNAWNGNQVGYGYWQLFSNPDFNPESDPIMRQHNVLIFDSAAEIVILGFEDINREANWCDHDFNDAVFYVTATDYEDINTTNVINSVVSSNVYSSNAGGFESNGDLAGLMARRSMDKMKDADRADRKAKQKKYRKEMYKTEDLGSFFPETGMNGYESPYVATSLDLVNYANALDVFSVDYYAGDQRVSAGLVTTTDGEIYDHGKTTCDRLNNSELLDVRTVNLRGHDLIFSLLKRDDGNTEYAISFSVKEGEEANELYSLWNIASYPEGKFRNFQVWGESMSQVAHIVNFVLDQLVVQKPLDSSHALPQLPPVFVKSAYYANRELHLEVINKAGARSAAIEASLQRTENSDYEEYRATVELSGRWNDHVVVETGYLFDIGLSFTGEGAAVNDALYLADGPWGIDFQEETVTLSNFEIGAQETVLETASEDFFFERSIMAAGTASGPVNLFRTLKPGDLTMEVTDFEAIRFQVQNNVPVEVSLIPAELEDWNDRPKYQIPANETMTAYELSFEDFANELGETIALGELRSVIFSVIPKNGKSTSFEVAVRDLALTAIEKEEVITSVEQDLDAADEVYPYPNPFYDQTKFKLPKGTTAVALKVFDLTGKVLFDQSLPMADDGQSARFVNEGLPAGMYRYILVDQDNERYMGSFLIK